MLSNAYFLAKFRFDTAENEPAKNLQILQKKMQNAFWLPQRHEVRTKDAHVMEGMVVSKMQREFARYREDLLAAAERARKAEVKVASARWGGIISTSIHLISTVW